MQLRNRVVGLAAAVGAGISVGASGQVRIAQWNITNWQASSVAARGAAFQSAFYGVAPNGLQFAPDLLVAEEMEQGGTGATAGHQSAGQTNALAFLNLLNTAPGSPGDWTVVTYVANGGDTGNALFYRTSKFAWIATSALNFNTGTGADQPPRDTQKWVMRPFGYSVGSTPATPTGAQLYFYGGHFKAQDSSTTTDETRRQAEGNRLRTDTNTLPAGIGGFLVCADFNLTTSTDLAYRYMVEYPNTTPRDVQAGQFIDPINSPGGWNNNGSFQYIHTQEPSTQMDDRHDQILVSASLVDHQGLSYIFTGTTITGGNPYGIPIFSTSTWNDPNHTYRCWGNDGGHFNNTIISGGVNNQVGLTIANNLITTVSGNGHLPVYLDMQVPAKLGVPSGTIDFGSVAINAVAQQDIQITNAADVARFSKPGTGFGIDTLTYTLAASSGYSAPAGTFSRPATSPDLTNTHTLTMDTSTPGLKSGTLTITTDDPDNPTRIIQFTGLVTSEPNYDVNDDGIIDIEDLYAWTATNTDVDGNGVINAADGAALVAFLRQAEVPDVTFARR